MYIFRIINPTLQDWNLIETAYDSTCYHTQAWNTYLRRIGCSPFILEIKEDTNLVGHFIGNKVGFCIHLITAPAQGVGTYSQGLCLQNPISQEKRIQIYQELSKWLFAEKIASILQVDDWQLKYTTNSWVANDKLNHPLLDEADIKYVWRPTLSVLVNTSEEEMWSNLHYKSCKYSINKARKIGLHVEEITNFSDIKEFVKVHYNMLKDVCARHGAHPTISQRPNRMLALCESLFPNRILMLKVVGEDETGVNQIMATSIFCIDKGQCSYWTGASFQKYQKYCPNELMVWEAMKKLHKIGGGDLNFCGIAEYKLKFGTSYKYVPRITFAKYEWMVGILPWMKIQYNKIKQLIKR